MTGSNVTRRGMIGGGVGLAAIAASGDTVGPWRLGRWLVLAAGVGPAGNERS